MLLDVSDSACRFAPKNEFDSSPIEKNVFFNQDHFHFRLYINSISLGLDFYIFFFPSVILRAYPTIRSHAFAGIPVFVNRRVFYI